MPDRMPDRMPENMSDRMPEDLPVTKCINVMVGITRSKVFFLSDEWSEFIGKGLIQLFWFDNNSTTQKTNQTTNNHVFLW